MRSRIHRTRGTTVVVGTGSAVRPVTLCLSAQGSRHDRSNDRATLDGLKLFRLARAWFSDLCPLWSFGSRRGPSVVARCSDRCPSPPGFPRLPTLLRSRCSAFDAGMSGYLGRLVSLTDHEDEGAVCAGRLYRRGNDEGRVSFTLQVNFHCRLTTSVSIVFS